MKLVIKSSLYATLLQSLNYEKLTKPDFKTNNCINWAHSNASRLPSLDHLQWNSRYYSMENFNTILKRKSSSLGLHKCKISRGEMKDT
jgi:hypothetical protein